MTVAGLGYFTVYASAQIIADWISGSVPFYDYIHIPFIILFGVSIAATWARPKVGYFMGLISGVAGIAILSPFTFVKGVSSPADFGLFFYVITIFPMMLAAALYSLMGIFGFEKSKQADLFKSSVLATAHHYLDSRVYDRGSDCRFIGSRH